MANYNINRASKTQDHKLNAHLMIRFVYFSQGNLIVYQLKGNIKTC